MIRFAVLTTGAALALAAPAAPAGAQDAQDATVDEVLAQVQDTIIRLREHIHQYPELGNREFNTAALVADHLRALGFDEVRTGIAHTGVVGILRGGLPGPVVAVRADMDALPVTEMTPYPFRSTVRTTYLGQEVGVSHACGHDIHVAVQLGVASVLAGMRDELPGTVKFIFQPAEEGPPPGEDGGARMMVAEGVLQDPAPSAIFGLHSFAEMEVGKVGFTSGPALAARGPLQDPHPGAAGPRRRAPSGDRSDRDGLPGGQRVPDHPVAQPAPARAQRGDGGDHPGRHPLQHHPARGRDGGHGAHLQPRRARRGRAAHGRDPGRDHGGGGRHLRAGLRPGGRPRQSTTPRWASACSPRWSRVVGADNVVDLDPTMGGEDFAYFANEVPGFFFRLGQVLPGGTSGGHHTPDFQADNSAVPVGIRAMTNLLLDYLKGARPAS